MWISWLELPNVIIIVNICFSVSNETISIRASSAEFLVDAAFIPLIKSNIYPMKYTREINLLHKSATISFVGNIGGNDTGTGRQVLRPTNHVAPLINTSGKLPPTLTNHEPGSKCNSSRDSIFSCTVVYILTATLLTPDTGENWWKLWSTVKCWLAACLRSIVPEYWGEVWVSGGVRNAAFLWQYNWWSNYVGRRKSRRDTKWRRLVFVR